jgi:hypothetical protein
MSYEISQKPDAENQWKQARQLEDAMVAQNLKIPCYGHRCPHSDMQIGLTDTSDPNILEVLISSET